MVAAGLAVTIAIAPPAAAATFSNGATITLPDPNCTDPDAGVPYPANIAVSGLTGTISDVNVTLNGVTHPFEGDIEILLVAPNGTNLELLSDAGTGALSNAAVTFDDAAASQPPQNSAWSAGTYKPVNYIELSGADTFPAPAPAPSANTTLGAFNGIAGNGTWSLYVTDDACADAGSIAGGWSLDITTNNAAATTTTVTATPNPSTTGQLVTFTATVTSGSPVSTGTVTFTEGATTLAAAVAVNASGQASFTKSNFPEGNHIVKATYDANATFATSNGTVNQRVDNATTVNGSTYCNTGPIVVNALAPATPYPSNIFVTGGFNTIAKVTATLKNVSHTFTDDLDVLLVGPAGQNLVLVSDAGNATTTNVTATFDDTAASSLTAAGAWAAPNATITVKPANITEVSSDTFAAPAPAPSAATALSTFNNTNSNGTWALYVMSDGAPDTGSIAGGWCLTFTSGLATPTISTTASAGGLVGSNITDTATLTGGASPGGTVTFTLFGPNDTNCAGQVIATSSPTLAGGSATSSPYTTAAVGTYNWVAVYSGDTNNNSVTSPCGAPNESATVAQATPTLATQASAGGPPGTALSDTATVSGGFNPGGTVTFKLYGPNDASCTGTAVFAPSAVNVVSGQATSPTFPPSLPGTYRWVATYNGDTNNTAVPGGCNAPNESALIKTPTSVVPSGAPNPSVYGQPVTVTATVCGAPPQPTAPTGAVTFTDGASPLGSAVTLVDIGSGCSAASLVTSSLSAVPHSITATYGGDTTFLGNSGSFTQTVNPAATTTVVANAPTSSVFGQPVTATATVCPVVPSTMPANRPSGTIIFFDGATPLGVGVPVVAAAGNCVQATFTSSSFSVATHSITATYSGDASFTGAASPGATLTVNPASTTMMLTSAPHPSALGQSVTLTALVCPAAPSTAPSAPPLGSVTFMDGAAALAPPVTLVAGPNNCGQATFTTSSLAPGAHALSAVYAGNTNYTGITGTTSHTVTCANNVTGNVNSVTASGTTCITGATVNGSVNVSPGATVFITNSRITGSLSSNGAATLTVCNTTVNGSVAVQNSSGFVMIGGDGQANCLGNTIGGTITLTSNHGGLRLAGNRSGTAMVSTDNVATPGVDPAGGVARIVVRHNTITGSLICGGNSPPASNDTVSNSVTGGRSGECASPTF